MILIDRLNEIEQWSQSAPSEPADANRAEIGGIRRMPRLKLRFVVVERKKEDKCKRIFVMRSHSGGR